MPDDIRHDDGQVEHPEIRHEPSDANFKAILKIVIGAMVFAAVVHFAILMFFKGYRAHEDRVKKSPYALAPAPSMELPREPRLEQIDRMEGVERPDIRARLTAKEDVLNSYGPTDERGYVHIPVEKAIEMLAGKLPARKEPPRGTGKGNGLVDGGGPNSGRLLRKEGR